jgi:hypothetical protein
LQEAVEQVPIYLVAEAQAECKLEQFLLLLKTIQLQLVMEEEVYWEVPQAEMRVMEKKAKTVLLLE